MKAKWLTRTLMIGPYLSLCTSQKEFDLALKHLKVDKAMPYIAGHSATTHTFERDGDIVCIVCLSESSIRRRPIGDTANILVHEAVHVWQAYRSNIGETKPSSEFEAYSIQTIFYTLYLEAMARRNR